MRDITDPLPDHYGTDDWEGADAPQRELKIGDRVVDWCDEAGTVISVSHSGEEFFMRYDRGEEESWGWVEFGSDEDYLGWQGTFRFEDTEYPEWPR